MNETTIRLLHKFQDEDYRYAYDEEFANSRMAMQIQAIREAQELTQQQLAELAEMGQSRISALENVNYSMWTVSTLRRLAKVLGVRFSFGFESWGELLKEIEESDREHLVRPRFEKDPVFAKTKQGTVRQFPTKLKQPVVNPTSGVITLRMLAEVKPSKKSQATSQIKDSTPVAPAPAIPASETRVRMVHRG